ncbi:hypothetical protein NUSPORA_00199 [Nucleospora cyclopteri]
MISRKCFTKPPEIAKNHDNINKELVVYKGDKICKTDDNFYMIVQKLGKGMYGQVFRCVDHYGEEFAIKITKNDMQHFNAEINEVRILDFLAKTDQTKYFPKIHDKFFYKNHFCIVMELNYKNLYKFNKSLKFTGLPPIFVREVARQTLEALSALNKYNIIHGDIKPENICLKSDISSQIQLIDFSTSAIKQSCENFYAQSRFYRAPETILGIPYTSSIDMWSFGCVIYEVVVGSPLFPGKDNFDQIHLINEFCENGIPKIMLDQGVNTKKYFHKENENYIKRVNENKFTIYQAIQNIETAVKDPQLANLISNFIFKCLSILYLHRETPQKMLEHDLFKHIFKEGKDYARNFHEHSLPIFIKFNRRFGESHNNDVRLEYQNLRKFTDEAYKVENPSKRNSSEKNSIDK